MLERYTLSNGIPVFVVESHASPVVSIQAWVQRGSADENEGVAGISHFLEHALFKGTKKRQVGEIAKEIESRGGEINAFTSFEETAYYTTLASRYFEQGLDVIADAVQNPSFDPDEMTREREVILEEIKRAFDSPAKMVSTNLWKTCFKDTPFGRPVLGFEETVRKIDAKRLREYFTKNYHAGSIALFVVGDVDRDKVFKLAKQKFGRLKKRKAASGNGKAITPSLPRKVRVVTISRDIKECQLQIGVPAPEIKDKSIPALDLMCSAIGQGESSRLYQSLVKDNHLALDVQMGLIATGRCGMITLAMVASEDKLEKALQMTVKILQEAAEEGLEESELERVKNSLESDAVAGKETVDGYARRLGYYYCQFGDPDYEAKYLEDILAVTVEDATEALRQFLAKKPVISIAHPEGAKIDKDSIAKILTLKPGAKRKAAAKLLLPYKKEIGGIKYVSKKLNHLPVVSLKIVFPGGARLEKPSQYGIATLFQRVWTAGTKSYSCLQISHVLESLGASISGFSGRNSVGLDVEFLSKHWPVMKPFISEILTAPAFAPTEFETERSLMLRAIDSEKDSPANLCHMNFLEAVYPNHCYGRSMLGTKETVSAMTPEDLVGFFNNNIQRNGMVVSSVGSFPAKDWEEELHSFCGGLPEKKFEPIDNSSITEFEGIRAVTAHKTPLFQSHILLGFLGGSFQSPERYALKLLSSCLAGQGGRLFLELRDRQSLAYTVAPINTDGPARGVFAFYIGCSPEKLPRSIAGIRNEIDRLLEKPIRPAELKRAKEYWIGRFELDMQRYGSQAGLYGLDEFYGLGFNHSAKVPELIKSVTIEDLQKAARKFFLPEKVCISVVHHEPITNEEVINYWNQKGLDS